MLAIQLAHECLAGTVGHCVHVPSSRAAAPATCANTISSFQCCRCSKAIWSRNTEGLAFQPVNHILDASMLNSSGSRPKLMCTSAAGRRRGFDRNSHACLCVLFKTCCERRTEQLPWKTLPQSLPCSTVVRQPQITSDDVLQQSDTRCF
jgi:hypothetical protein